MIYYRVSLTPKQPRIKLVDPDFEADIPPWPEIDGLAEEEIDWIVPGVWPTLTRFVLTGTGGVGKATWLRQTCALMAAGRDPFNPSKEISRQKIVIFDLQDDKRTNSENWLDIWDSLGPKLKKLAQENIKLVMDFRNGCNLNKEEDRIKMETIIDRERPSVVMIGPIYRAFDTYTSNEGPQVTKLTQFIDELRDEYQCAFLIEAHPPGSTAEGNQKITPSGSSVWANWTDAGFYMSLDFKSDYLRIVKFLSFREARNSNNPMPIHFTSDGPFVWNVITENQYKTAIKQAHAITETDYTGIALDKIKAAKAKGITSSKLDDHLKSKGASTRIIRVTKRMIRAEVQKKRDPKTKELYWIAK